MTITDEIKILNRKIMQNEAQYNLDRKAAKIKGLSKDDKKERLFKSLENKKDKNKDQLQAIKDQGEKQLKELNNIDKSKALKLISGISKKNDEANKLLSEFRKMMKHLIIQKLFVQKAVELNMSLIIFHLHSNLLKKFVIMKLL